MWFKQPGGRCESTAGPSHDGGLGADETTTTDAKLSRSIVSDF